MVRQRDEERVGFFLQHLFAKVWNFLHIERTLEVLLFVWLGFSGLKEVWLEFRPEMPNMKLLAWTTKDKQCIVFNQQWNGL